VHKKFQEVDLRKKTRSPRTRGKMEDVKDYYHILGVTRNADYDEIKKSYHRLMLLLHPDKQLTHDVDVVDKIQDVLEAWEILGDTEKRARYDTKCQGW